MGAVMSCIEATCQQIGRILMAIVNGIGFILTSIVNGIVSLFDILVGCLICGKGRGQRRRGATSHV